MAASEDKNLHRAMVGILGSDRPLSNDFRLQVADEVERLRERAENAESDRNAFRERFKEQSAMAERAEAEAARYREAILWACGIRGEFRCRRPEDGAFWWRKELRERAGISSDELNREAVKENESDR